MCPVRKMSFVQKLGAVQEDIDKATTSLLLFSEILHQLEVHGFRVDDSLHGFGSDTADLFLCDKVLVGSEEVANYGTNVGHEKDYRRLRLGICLNRSNFNDPLNTVFVMLNFVTEDADRHLYVRYHPEDGWEISVPFEPIWHEADLVSLIDCRIGEHKPIKREQAFDAIRIMVCFFMDTRRELVAACLG